MNKIKSHLRMSLPLTALILTMFAAPAGAADKPVLAVAEFKNQTGAGWWRGGVGWELSDMLTNELASTEKFKMVERKKLQSVLKEQDLAASGRIRPGTGAKIGQVTGAQYLVTGTVSSYQEKTEGMGGGISFGGVSVGGKRHEAYMAVDLRVINTTTGDVEFVRTVEAKSSGGGMNLGVYRGGFGGHLNQYQDTPAGKAIRGVIMEISEYLGCVMVDKDSCLAEYKEKETKRREKTKGSIKLDE
jgi:curli biogenesis system outer membrane secretion channel CsgG